MVPLVHAWNFYDGRLVVEMNDSAARAEATDLLKIIIFSCWILRALSRRLVNWRRRGNDKDGLISFSICWIVVISLGRARTCVVEFRVIVVVQS